MCDSASPANKNNALAPRPLTTARDNGHWFAISVLLHLLAVALLLFATPVGSALLDEVERSWTRAEDNMSSARLAEILRQMEAGTATALRGMLERQSEIRRQMLEIRDTRAQNYKTLAAHRREQAPNESLNDMQLALERMDEAIAALDDPSVSRDQANRMQLAAAMLHERIATHLRRSPIDLPATHEAQEKVSALQAEAQAGQREIIAAERERRISSRRRNDLDQEIQRQQQRLERHDEHVARAERNAQEVVDELATLQLQHEALSALEDPDGRERRDLARTERHMTRQQERLQGQQRRIEEQQAERDEAAQELAALEEQLPDLDKAVAEARTMVAEARQLTADRQRAVREAQASVLEILRKEIAQDQASETPQDEEVLSRPTPAQTSATRVADLYRSATQVETTSTEVFREARAVELAMLRDLDVAEAIAITDVARPTRVALRTELFDRRSLTPDQFTEARMELATSMREGQNMVGLAEMMLAELLGRMQEHELGMPLTLEQIHTATTQHQVMENLADVEVSGDAVDLVEEMVEHFHAPPLRQQVEYLDEAHPEVERRPVTEHIQRIGLGGDRPTTSGWVNISRWYIIGPYDNRDRANIDRVLLPETVVDLDAVYPGEGKNGQDLRWTYTIAHDETGMMEPYNWESWAIFYAYTEIEVEEPTDVWLALGSDDQGRVWINGVKVWESARHHKPWNANEAYRRVHLIQGRNRILYRCENGQMGMGFSMLLHLGQEETPAELP